MSLLPFLLPTGAQRSSARQRPRSAFRFVVRRPASDVQRPTSNVQRPVGLDKWLSAAALAVVLAPRALMAHAGGTVHGLWVWKSASVLAAPRAAETLRDFCQANHVTEVYVSVATRSLASEEGMLTHVIDVLHHSNIRVEALLSSTDADEAGKPREKFLDHVRSIIEFNRQHPTDRFDGVHLDIEPQQRPENKGAGNLRFLPGLVEAYRAVRSLAEAEHLTVNGDIQNKLLKGSLEDRRMLLSALPRLTLMLYELSTPSDAAAADAEKLRRASREYLEMAYQGLDGSALAAMAIALRTPDYGPLLPQMLDVLDETNRADPHYLGWARHSYNDTLEGATALK